MGRFFVRVSDLLTPRERERLAELNKNGIPQYIRDRVNNHADEYWKNFELANYIAANICLGEPFERQEAVTALLETNQKKSRRRNIIRGVVGILVLCVVLYEVVKLTIWLADRLL